jgi:8-oxo-dGTP pyrophosphatase MutT (NUDIX family)|tara:strand:+ start:700 stop:1104 length:405 start_codon:yes stop_codon:yes gene_type:complete
MNKNIRSYGLIIYQKKILVTNEIINDYHATKFPGGGVERNETPEDALKRELYEELRLKSDIKLLLNAPGTLLSPWNNKLYTPLYYYVEASGKPSIPDNEKLTIDYLLPEEILFKDNVAEPEKVAVQNLIKNNLI